MTTLLFSARLRPVGLALGLYVPALICGCHGSSSPTAQTAAEKADAQALMETQRAQMDLIPPPAKSRYMAIHSFESWQNPYLTVQPGMVELHVTLADANPTSMGVGGMFRPVAARQQVLNIDLDKLGDAMTAVPQSAWPYGRVVAIEEAHKTPLAAEPSVRRNMERTISLLNNLGVIAYDPADGKQQ